MMVALLICFLCIILVVNGQSIPAHRPTEEERVQLWHDRGNVWPPEWQPETDGMKRLMSHREVELQTQVKGGDERWENWLQLTQSRLVPKFTQRGFDIIEAPKELFEKLKDAVEKGVKKWDTLPSEGNIDVIYHPENMEPKFVNLGSLQRETIDELKHLHEGWAGGMELRATSAYGVRLYQNGSSLVMHHDKVQTHVISSIFHIAHEYDDPNEQWPIEIEDHDGNLHSVNLKPGQMLFYESAKCLHGRMQELKGKYYGSIFLHYQPVEKEVWDYSVDKIIEHVPPHWRYGVDASEGKGSRWCGAAASVDSRTAEGAPHLKRRGKIIKETVPHNYLPIQPPPEYYPGEEPEEAGTDSEEL
jgi:hypothetical protein